MASNIERFTNTGNGYRRQSPEGLVAVLRGTCLESSYLSQDRKEAVRLSGLRRKDPAENDVIQPVETGRI